MENLDDVSAGLNRILARRFSKFRTAGLFVKVGLIGIGTCVTVIAQFAEPAATWHVIGILAAFIVLLGVAFLALTEDEAAREMQVAGNAILQAKRAQSEANLAYRADEALHRAIYLHLSFWTMRGVLERAAVNGCIDDKTLRQIVDLVEHPLPIALGFEKEDEWTISVYRALPSQTWRAELKCFATIREIRCEVVNARSWYEGLNIAGHCYSSHRKVIISDLQSSDARLMYDIGPDIRPHDVNRYRSIAAFPIIATTGDPNEKPWGVVLASSNKPFHFDEADEPGLPMYEPLETLAGMLALGVSMMSKVAAAAAPQS